MCKGTLCSWYWSEASCQHLINVPLSVAQVFYWRLIVPLQETQLLWTIEPNLKTLIYSPVEELGKLPVWMTLEVMVPPWQWEDPRDCKAQNQRGCGDCLQGQEIPCVLVSSAYEETYGLLMIHQIQWARTVNHQPTSIWDYWLCTAVPPLELEPTLMAISTVSVTQHSSLLTNRTILSWTVWKPTHKQWNLSPELSILISNSRMQNNRPSPWQGYSLWEAGLTALRFHDPAIWGPMVGCPTWPGFMVKPALWEGATCQSIETTKTPTLWLYRGRG